MGSTTIQYGVECEIISNTRSAEYYRFYMVKQTRLEVISNSYRTRNG